MTHADAETLRTFSKVLWGASIWHVTLDIQHRILEGHSAESLSELCLSFHVPLAVPEKVRKHRKVGSLWIDNGSTGIRLERGGRILVAGNDSAVKILDHFPKMIGSQLLEVVVRPPGGDTTFIFDDDLILNCFHANSRENDAWVIRTTDNDRIRLGPGARVTYETGLR